MRTHTKQGFTIVELLIVIVVIAILAAVTIVAYNGIQARARDSIRESNINSLVKTFQLYATEEGEYPSTDNDYYEEESDYYSCGFAYSPLAIKYGLSPDLFRNPSAPEGFRDATNRCQDEVSVEVPGKKYANWDEFDVAYYAAWESYEQANPWSDEWEDDEWVQYEEGFAVQYPDLACALDINHVISWNGNWTYDCSSVIGESEIEYIEIKDEWRYYITALYAVADTANNCHHWGKATGLEIRYWSESTSSWKTQRTGSGTTEGCLM